MRRVKDPRRTKIHCEFDPHQRYFCRSGGTGIRICFKNRILRVQLPSPVQCPGGEILVNAHDSDLYALTGLRVRLPPWVFRCDATTGNGPVLKTGDPRKRTGGSSPSHSALQTWLNWQKHLPAKEGPGDRHAGSRPAVCVKVSLLDIILKFYTRNIMTNEKRHVIVRQK